MNEDMKYGYRLALNSLNDDIDEMIEELHNVYMNHKNEDTKARLDAQIKILWSVKGRSEDKLIDCQ